MSLQYSGGTIINRTTTLSVRGSWINFVSQALSDAGWTTISGTPGSEVTNTPIVQESAAGNLGQKIRTHFVETGTGNCDQAFIKHTSNTPVSQAFFPLSTVSNTWRVVADKYHFFSFVSGSGSRTSRTFVAGGILYAPSFFTLSAGDGLGWMMGNATADTDASTKCSWRTTFRPYDGSNAGGRFSGIYVATLADISNYTTQIGNPSLGVWQGGYNTADTAYRWEDGTLPIYEPLVGWCTGTTNANEAKMKGQLYDAAIVAGSYTSETQLTFDGHNWIAITDQLSGGMACDSSLFVAVS